MNLLHHVGNVVVRLETIHIKYQSVDVSAERRAEVRGLVGGEK